MYKLNINFLGQIQTCFWEIEHIYIVRESIVYNCLRFKWAHKGCDLLYKLNSRQVNF